MNERKKDRNERMTKLPRRRHQVRPRHRRSSSLGEFCRRAPRAHRSPEAGTSGRFEGVGREDSLWWINDDHDEVDVLVE